MKCINDEESNITGYIIHIKNEIDYELNMNDVLYHANILLDNIDFFIEKTIFGKFKSMKKERIYVNSMHLKYLKLRIDKKQIWN